MTFNLTRLVKAATIVTPLILVGCATGNTPESKKSNARKETNAALQEVYSEHKGAKTAVANSVAFVTCTGSNSYLFALSTAPLSMAR